MNTRHVTNKDCAMTFPQYSWCYHGLGGFRRTPDPVTQSSQLPCCLMLTFDLKIHPNDASPPKSGTERICGEHP